MFYFKYGRFFRRLQIPKTCMKDGSIDIIL